MSYNITAWKIQHFHLELPLTFDFQSWVQSQPRRDEKGYENTGRRWCLEDGDSDVLINLAASTWKLSMSGKELSGIIKDDKLIAETLNSWTSDGSGILYNDILIPLFKEFKGNLEALVIWEGGDSLYQVRINDGIVEETEL